MFSDLPTSKSYNTLMKLIIIGPMASGKSVVGKKLSKRMNLDFFDTDESIEIKQVLVFLGFLRSKEKVLSERGNLTYFLN